MQRNVTTNRKMQTYNREKEGKGKNDKSWKKEIIFLQKKKFQTIDDDSQVSYFNLSYFTI